jgi:hypothetical protein
LNLLAPEGRLAFILPNTLMQGRQFGRLRQEITARARVESLVDFPRVRIFGGAEVYCMILQLRAGRPDRAAHDAPYLRIHDDSPDRGGGIERDDDSPWPGGKEIGNHADSPPPRGEEIRIHRESPEPWRRIDPRIERLREEGRVTDLSPRVALCRDGGLDYKYKSVGWAERGRRPRLGGLLVYEGPRRHPEDKPLIRGRDIEPFRIRTAERYLIHDWKKLRSGERTVIAYPGLMEVPVKILTRQTADRLVAALDRQGRYTAKSVHTLIVTDPHYTPEFLCALLNSGVMTRIYRTLTGERGRTFAQVRVSDLRGLPVPRMGSHEAGRRDPLWRARRERIRRSLAEGRLEDLEDFVDTVRRRGGGERETAILHALVTEMVRFLERSKSVAVLEWSRSLDRIFDGLYALPGKWGCNPDLHSGTV